MNLQQMESNLDKRNQTEPLGGFDNQSTTEVSTRNIAIPNPYRLAKKYQNGPLQFNLK